MPETTIVKEKNTELDNLLEEFQEELESRAKRYVKCKNCSHVLTYEEMAISVAGSHKHIKKNPYGLTFEFCCYGEALGCSIVGEDEAADSWFAGCVWQFLHCGACNQHLGWYFHGAMNFYGMRSDTIQIE